MGNGASFDDSPEARYGPSYSDGQVYARPDVEEFKLSQQDLLQFGALFAGRIALTCVDGGCSILSMVEDIKTAHSMFVTIKKLKDMDFDFFSLSRMVGEVGGLLPDGDYSAILGQVEEAKGMLEDAEVCDAANTEMLDMAEQLKDIHDMVLKVRLRSFPRTRKSYFLKCVGTGRYVTIERMDMLATYFKWTLKASAKRLDRGIWYLIQTSRKDIYILESAHSSGRCINVMGNCRIPGAHLMAHDNASAANSQWRLEYAGCGNQFFIRNKHSFLYMKPEGRMSDAGIGDPVMTQGPTPDDNAKFTFEPV